MKTFTLMAFLVIGLPAFCDGPFLFRDSPWGSTRGEVFNREGRRGQSLIQPYEDWGNKRIDILQFEKKQVSVYSAATEFHFLNNSLVAGRYNITLDTKNFSTQQTTKAYIDAYIDLQKRLGAIYNESKRRRDLEPFSGQESLTIINQLKQNAPYDTYWAMGDNGILLSLRSNKDNRWELIIQYYSPAMLALMTEVGTGVAGPASSAGF